MPLLGGETDTIRRFVWGGFHDAEEIRIAIQEMRDARDERPDPDVQKAVAEEEERRACGVPSRRPPSRGR